MYFKTVNCDPRKNIDETYYDISAEGKHRCENMTRDISDTEGGRDRETPQFYDPFLFINKNSSSLTSNFTLISNFQYYVYTLYIKDARATCLFVIYRRFIGVDLSLAGGRENRASSLTIVPL